MPLGVLPAPISTVETGGDKAVESQSTFLV